MIDQHYHLCKQLGYCFTNTDLLKQALTHRSMRGNNNERLEFLGDAVLSLAISAHLFKTYPNCHEGELSRLRAHLVQRSTLATLARSFKLGDYLRLGAGEQKTAGQQRQSILADTLEALMGAIFLDSNFLICAECIIHWYAEPLENVLETAVEKDPKTQLQEYLQSQHQLLPTYTLQSISGVQHEQDFIIECVVDKMVVIGKGRNRREAEKSAAKKCLHQLKTQNKDKKRHAK